MSEQPENKAQDNCVRLRPITADDFGAMVQWINAPHVAAWWDSTTDLPAVTEKYGPHVGNTDKAHVLIIEVGGRSVGFIQCYRHGDYPNWDSDVAVQNAAGIDYAVGDPDFVGQGVGTQAIRQISAMCFEIYPEIDVVVAVPQQANRASCRVLERAGFVCLAQRKLQSECPSDAGISSIYALDRPAAKMRQASG